MGTVEKIKDIILENNYFNTLAGERFKEWHDIKDIVAVISFSGRSKKQECYRLTSESESEGIYVTHLYVDSTGEVKVQLATEDTDDINLILHPSNERIEMFDDDIIKEWIELLTW